MGVGVWIPDLGPTEGTADTAQRGVHDRNSTPIATGLILPPSRRRTQNANPATTGLRSRRQGD